MKKLTTLFLLLTLAACGPAVITTPTIAPSPSSTPAPPMATSTPVAVTERCAEILPAFPEGIVSSGILVLSSPDGLSLLIFNQQTQRAIPGLIFGVGTSPNGNWLSYISTTDFQLTVESADGQKQLKLPFDPDGAVFDNILWLDNDRLWFPVWNGVDRDPQTLVLNPFTGERQVLSPAYPDFAPFLFNGSSSLILHFGYGNVAYDPSLRFVIYPLEADGTNFTIALWDRETKQTVTKVDNGAYWPAPLWLSNSDAFLVRKRPESESPWEWFMVSVDGKVRQLTHLGDQYGDYEFGEAASLSPDGRYLAFGLFRESDPSPGASPELIILDLTTLSALNTCITFNKATPIWSSDSQYLVIRHPDTHKRYPSVVMLNVDTGWAASVFQNDDENRYLVGWLDSGE